MCIRDRLATATNSGACNATRTNNNTGAPPACGGTRNVTWTVTSQCESPVTCSASFTVTNAPAVVLNCPVSTTVTSCQTQGQVDAAFAAWLATATNSGGCNATRTNNNTGAPPACGGTRNVTFTVTSSCEAPVTCSASFTVTNAPAVVLNCPVSTTVTSCQTQGQVDAAFAAWLATATNSGGCNATRTNNNTTAPPACGGTRNVTFTVTSSCQSPVTCSASFTVT